MPARTRPGSPAPDAPMSDASNEWLLGKLGNGFQILAIDIETPQSVCVGGICANRLALSAKDNPALRERYLGDAEGAIYLMRPDQHVAARWDHWNDESVRQAIETATGRRVS